MLPSQTVENYLKAIFQAQAVLSEPRQLVPMGQLSAALGVVPGTATSMVKALFEAGLVHYEPYVGVRLTAAGEKLAAAVLRRHRLIELFLVKVMGMSWAEVHEEAEQLEHAVSDRLIERIDDMLGHPEVDPHGDPIPRREGTLQHAEYQSLLDCPLNTPVTVSRVTDQDAEFLRFLEHSSLKPGEIIEIEARDAAADSVRVRRPDGQRTTIGARAAAKLLVKAVLVLLCTVSTGFAQTQAPTTGPDRPFEILYNSFLLEEAFNQEAGIFQNIFGLQRIGGGWEFVFTQEWPVRTQTHQLSFSLPVLGGNGATGLGDVLLNYRYQALTEGPGRPAFSPRISLIVPSGDRDEGLGDGVVGLQVNLPFSKQSSDVYFHWNAGFTWLPGVEPSGPIVFAGPVRAPDSNTLFTPHIAGSVIYRHAPMFNVMLEGVVRWEELLEDSGTSRYVTAWTLSPGVRGGWNVGDHQIIAGVALPLTIAGDESSSGVFLYFSYELPFRR